MLTHIEKCTVNRVSFLGQVRNSSYPPFWSNKKTKNMKKIINVTVEIKANTLDRNLIVI